MKTPWSLQDCRRWHDLTEDIETQEFLFENTYVDVENTVRQKVEQFRNLISAATFVGVSSKPLLKYDLQGDKEATLARAYFVGAERGMRIGRPAAKRMILEAREFARLQLANNAPFLGDVEPIEDD